MQVAQLEISLDESKAELGDEQREGASMRAQLAKRSEEREMLYDTLARFQVLHGVAPLGPRERDSFGSTTMLLRRQLVDLEALALQKEMGTLDAEEESGAAAVERLKSQLAEQHRRLRELEPLVEVAEKAKAAEQEVALLKEQLHELACNRLRQVTANATGNGKGVSTPGRPALSLCTRTQQPGGLAPESFRAKEAFGQHLLRGRHPEDQDASTPVRASADAAGEVPDATSTTPARVAAAAAEAAAARAAELDKELQLE